MLTTTGNGTTESKDGLTLAFWGIPLALVLTWIVYSVITQIYIPTHNNGGYNVFLPPRYLADGPRDFAVGVFTQWRELAILFPVLIGILSICFLASTNRRVSFNGYIVLVYLLGLFVAWAFLFFTPHGLDHIFYQARSIKNGIFQSLGVLMLDVPEFRDASNLDRIRYIYQVLGATNAGYTLPGTTHPPGLFLIASAFGVVAKTLAMGGSGESAGDLITSMNSIALYWGLIVTLVNTLLIPLSCLIAKEVYSERIGRLTGLMLLTVPSVCMNFCAMLDVVASVLTASGALCLIYALKQVNDKSDHNTLKRLCVLGLLCGLSFTLAAQMTYGHAVPILAFIVAFLLIARPSNCARLLTLFAGMLLPVVLYFAFEYFVSAGKSFYIVRALKVSADVGTGLAEFRPYPVSQIANFVVMSVMGGALWLPTVLFAVATTVRWIRDQARERFIPPSTYPDTRSGHLSIRRFLALASSMMLVFLLVQKTVLLEVERTWHWFFVPTWSLMGVFLLASTTFFERAVPSRFARFRRYAPLLLCIFQFVLTLVIAICTKDFY
jgi:hypothetical protein